MLGISTTNARVGGFRGGISAEAKTIYNRIIADGGVSNLTRLNFFVKGLKAIYGDLANVPVCYDAHWIGYKLGSGTGATAGQAAAKLYSLTVAGDAVQATAASQPLLLAHNGASSDNYYYSGATNGNYVSTPDSANATFSGDLDVRVRVVNFVSNQTQVYVSKRGTSGFVFYSDTSGIINLEPWSVVSTVAVANGFSGWLRITKTSTEIKFFTGTNSDDPTFTQLGATLSGTYANPATNSLILGIGGIYNTSTLTYFASYCKILRVTKANSIGGTPVVDFNPATYNAATSQTAWTSTTGEVWTINTGTATTGYKGVLVDRTVVQSDGVDDLIETGNALNVTLNTRYVAINIMNISGGYIIHGKLSTTGDKHLLYQTAGNIQSYSSGGAINFNAIIAQRIALLTTDWNTTSSNNLTNNANQVNGTLASETYNTLQLFGNGIASFKNCNINTLIETSSVSTPTQKTATYNLIRSLNNNAF